MGRGLAGLAVLVAIAGCLDATSRDAPPEATAAGGDRVVGVEVLSPVEEFELDLSFTLWTEICDIVVPAYSGGGSERSIHFLPNETRTVLTFSWDPVNPTSEQLEFRLSNGPRTAVDFPGGPSPQVWELSAADAQGLGNSPNLYVYPACKLGATAASNDGQTVHVHVEHFV